MDILSPKAMKDFVKITQKAEVTAFANKCHENLKTAFLKGDTEIQVTLNSPKSIQIGIEVAELFKKEGWNAYVTSNQYDGTWLQISMPKGKI